MQGDKLTFALGRPLHGWLPVSLAMPGLTLDFMASAVPTDSLAELVSALLLVTQQAAAVVNWHLEPRAYRFEFSPEPSEGVRLSVSEAAPGTPARPLGSLSGRYEAVVLPIWRALQQLPLADFGGAAWPALPLAKLHRLRALVRARRGAAQS